MTSLIRRSFGIIDDSVAGGTSLEKLIETAGSTAAAAGTIPVPTTFWPVTGGNIDPTLQRIDRAAEVRGRRPVQPTLAFRAEPVATVPFPAYRSIIEKLLKKALGGADVVSGGATEGYKHTISPLGFGSVQLPAFHAQMVRDDLVHAMSGCVANKLSLAFPLEGEGTGEAEVHPLYYGNSNLTPPVSSFTETDNVLMLRDAQIVLDKGPTALTTPTAPTLAAKTSGGKLAAGSYNYKVVAYNSSGVTLGSPEAASPATTTGAEGSVVVTWTAVTGALGYRVYGRVAGSVQLLADVGNVLTFTDTGSITPAGAVPTVNTSGGSVPDLITFDWSFTNNVLKKHYANRNVAQMTVGESERSRVSRLWFPNEFKLGAEQDVTFGMTFGNTNIAQDMMRDYDAIQQIVFNVVGAPIAGTSPTVNESLQITMFNAVAAPGGGPDQLAARGDTTYRIEGNAFYSTAAAADIKVEVLNGLSSALT